MQGEGKRLLSQPPPPLHEQLSPPAGIHPLSTPPSSLTTPLPLKKKKLLKVILKAPNPNCPSHSPPPSPPPLSSASPPLSNPLLPQHHHHLQQHQLHHHQQLLLQQQHLHKQRLLQQQTQQLASELQLKLHQQHLLQQEHPKLLEQFKQQLEQEQICATSSLDSQSNCTSHWQQAASAGKDYRENFQAQENWEDVEKGEDRRNRRRRDRSRELPSNAPLEERFSVPKSRFKSEDGDNSTRGHTSHEQAQRSFRENGQEQANLQFGEEFAWEDEPDTKRLKTSEQQLEGDRHVRSSFRSPTAQRQKKQLSVSQKPVVGDGEVRHTLKSPVARANGLPPTPRLAPASSFAGFLDGQDTKKPSHSTDPAAWIKRPSFSKAGSEGAGVRDGTATGPTSKAPGGFGNASVPGKKVLRGILDKLQKKDSYGAFSEPVDPKEVPDYYDVIKEPMDFGSMRKRISSNFYTNLELFEKDIFAICNNATTFNAAGTVYHRQARAIKAAAERILDALRTSGPAGADAVLKQKIGGSQTKKSHKKKQPWKSWTSDYVAEPSLNLGGRGVVADSYYVDWQAGAGQSTNKINTEDKEDPSGYLAKSLGLYDGRRWQLNEESRRSTYRPHSNTECSSLANTVCGAPLQFVPAAFQLEFSYARSLARFAADLGPDVWKIAAEKIRKGLPMGVPFGPGWVGQREAPGRPIVSMSNTTSVHVTADAHGRTEGFPVGIGVAGEQRVVDGRMSGGTSGVVDSQGAVTTAGQVPLDFNLVNIQVPAASHGYKEEVRSSEIASLSQCAPQSFSEEGRDLDQATNSDRQRCFLQRQSVYPAQAACEVGLADDSEGEPVLIPGRDLDGRHGLDFNVGKSSVLHTGLASMPGAPIDGLQSSLGGNG